MVSDIALQALLNIPHQRMTPAKTAVRTRAYLRAFPFLCAAAGSGASTTGCDVAG